MTKSEKFSQSQPGNNIVEIRHFAMSFGKIEVIHDLNFVVKRGETFGFLGSNGSGKTTTLRALLGIYEPTSGELLINDEKFDVAGRTRIGYLPEERGLYKKENVLDVMRYFGELKGMQRDKAENFSQEFLERVGLKGYENTRIDKLSGGQQQKVQLGITIMNDPELLILDEPTKGFDPVNRRLLLDIIRERQNAGATVIMVTHDMSDVEKLCDHAILLKDGEAKVYGTIPDIRGQFGGKSMEDIFVEVYGAENGEAPAPIQPAQTKKLFRGFGGRK